MALASSWAGCYKTDEGIIGNGVVVQKSYPVPAFARIHLKGQADVRVIHAGGSGVAVIADENLHEYLKIRVRDTVLYIDNEARNLIADTLIVYVGVGNVERIDHDGSGNLMFEDTLFLNKFVYYQSGTGNADLAMSANDFEAQVKGTGNLVLAGSSTDVRIAQSGTGFVDGAQFSCANVIYNLDNTGNASIRANVKLTLNHRGSGTFTWFGLASDTSIWVQNIGVVRHF